MKSRLRPCLATGLVLLLAATIESPAEAHPLTEHSVRRLLPDVDVKPAPQDPSWLLLGTFREPHIKLGDAGFELIMDWNGIDDDQWPATRIVEVLGAELCGSLLPGIMQLHLDRLYQTKSLQREVDLGGNAGTTFKKRLAATLGACKITLTAQGARWHTLWIEVRR